MPYLGIDIGGTAAKFGIVSAQGEVLCTESYDVAFDGHETPILQTVLKSTDLFLEAQKTSITDIEAIGVSATGQIDVKRGMVVGSAGHIKNWLGADIKGAFEKKYGKRTSVLNDANAVVLGEQWTGRAKGCANVIAVAIGTGVGGGVICDSHLLNGNIGIGGELGHFTLKYDGIACTCGNRGCYEQYASMSALVKRVREALPRLDLPGVTANQINGKHVFKWFWDGNQEIKEIVDSWIDRIVEGLIGLTHIFNPEMILIGGGVSKEGERFMSILRSKVLLGVMPRFAEGLKIEATALGNDAGLVGAVRFCMMDN